MNEEILDKDFFQKIYQLWDIQYIKLISNVQNLIYEFENNDNHFILRITDSNHRNKNLIEAELEWIKFLDEKDISVAKNICSKNMNSIETVLYNNEYFFITVFEKAKGKTIDINNISEWNNNLFENWGMIAGKIHSLSNKYRPVNNRFQWFESELNRNFKLYLPKEDKFAIEEFSYLKNFLSGLSQEQDDFGLTHSDMHFKNFYIDKDQITLFDFDDSCYNWFIFDFITAFHHAVLMYDNLEKRQDFANTFFYHFFLGYKKEKNVTSNYFIYLSEFLRFRDLQMYILIHKKWNLENISKAQNVYLEQLKLRIIKKSLPVSLEKINQMI